MPNRIILLIMTPPKILYKYYPFNKEWLPSLLNGSKILFSSRTTFNDPFDSRPAIFTDPKNPLFRKEAMKVYKESKISYRKRKQLFQQAVGRTLNNDGSPKILDTSFADNMGILSLGTDWANMLLWSHYAEHHSGICIGFSTEIDFFQLARKVKYELSYPTFNVYQDSTNINMDIFLVKQKCWEYEDEWRIFKRRETIDTQIQNKIRHRISGSPDAPYLFEQNGPGLYSFDPRAIVDITIGLKCKDTSWLIDAAKQAKLTSPIYQISNSSSNFDLKRHVLKS